MNAEQEQIELLSDEDQFAADLAAAEALKPEHRRRRQPEATPATTPAPAPAEATPAPAEAHQEAPAPAPAATPAPAELFPGFNALPPETQAQVRSVYEAKANAERLAEERDRQYKQLHGKTAPLQSQHSKMLLEQTRLQQQLQELQKLTGKQNGSAFKEKLKEYKKLFPEEGQLIEDGMNAALTEAQAARELAAGFEQRLQHIDTYLREREEVAQVAQAHPDWQKLRTAFDRNSGQFVPKTDTQEAKDLCLWANSLDPQEREIIHPRLYSKNAADVIYALNRFKRDLQWAEAVRASANPGTAPSATPAPPAVKPALPEVDVDVTRRASPPASSPTRNDASTDEQEYASAVELWKQRQREKQRRS